MKLGRPHVVSSLISGIDKTFYITWKYEKHAVLSALRIRFNRWR